jgi:hypothetical protein
MQVAKPALANAVADSERMHDMLAADLKTARSVRAEDPDAQWGHYGAASPEFPVFLAVLRSHWCNRLHLFGQPSMESRSRKVQATEAPSNEALALVPAMEAEESKEEAKAAAAQEKAETVEEVRGVDSISPQSPLSESYCCECVC